MMFGYKIVRDAQAMCKRISNMMFGYKIKAMHKGCTSYAQENPQDDVWVLNQRNV